MPKAFPKRGARGRRALARSRLRHNGRFCSLETYLTHRLGDENFKKFLDLPTEIRFMIYEYAFAGRGVSVGKWI